MGRDISEFIVKYDKIVTRILTNLIFYTQSVSKKRVM